ncbi:unnamed protein product [Calicophoron daubneyi]|uniref:t-SNARE coiled-coil homology domain-containing protein n=1 Tax=Calicophoron daubneyi TaxID=300641 RepID=A0AAV2T8K2_CALDB
MACDVSRTFHTLIRAIQTTREINRSEKVRPKKEASNAFSFINRAYSLRKNLLLLADYVKRVQQLTASSVSNTVKQRVHAELTEQVTTLIDQCTALLIQLKEVSRLDDSGSPLSIEHAQLREHRQVVHESLEEQLNKLKELRDLETDRQRHLLELTSSLAAGVRSVGFSAKDSPFAKLPSCESNKFTRGRDEPPEFEVRNRRAVPSTSPSLIPVSLEDHSHKDESLNLTDAEVEAFEQENRVMYDHLSGQREEVTQVARAISEIGRLNQTLSMHLTEQLETVQQIGDSFVGCTEQVSQGNEQLRSALSNTASKQFWILFTLIVLTFSLHFLDWYYP